MRFQRNGNIVIIAVLVLINLIIYFNGIKNDFVWDGVPLVKNNYQIRDIGNVKKLLTEEDSNADTPGTGFFRPFVSLTFLLDYQVSKGKVYGFRTTNILFNIASVITLFFLVLIITDDRLLSFAAAAVFSAQTVHVEAVTPIIGRNNVVCGFFILLSLYYYIKSAKLEKNACFYYSLIFMFLGAASKEFAFMLPFIFILYDYSFSEEYLIKNGIRRYAAAFGVILVFIIYKSTVVQLGRSFEFEYDTLFKRIISTFPIMAGYLKNQIIPNKLLSYFDEPLKESFFEPSVLISFLIFAVSVFLVIWYRKKDRLIFFSFFTYLLLLVPVSNIVTIPGIKRAHMADRWLYPASAAFAILLVRLIFLALDKNKRLIPTITIAFVVFLSSFTVQRNHIFKNDFLLNLHEIKINPKSVVIRNNLATEYNKRGNVEEAEKHYKIAIENDPDYSLPYNNLGVIYASRKENEKALEYFKKAYELNPNYPLTAFNLAVTYNDLGNFEERNKFYNIAIELNPEYFDAYYNLASGYYKQKEYEKSLEILKRALEISYTKERKEGIRQKIEMVTGVMNSQQNKSSE